MVCTILLMLIDWTRGSQVGSTWAWTVNMMGVVIGVALIGMDGIENYLKKRYLIYSIISLSMLPMGYYWWRGHQSLIYRDKLLSAICNVWILGLCIIRLYGLKKDVWQRVKQNGFVLLILPVVMFVFMLVSKNEDVWPGWFLVLYVLIYGWKIDAEEKKHLINGIVDGIIICFFLLQGCAFVFRPYDDASYRYCGIYSNPNMNALFYNIVLMAFLFRLFQLRKYTAKVWKRVLCFLFAAALVGFSVLTVCKTAWIAELFCILLYVVVVDIKRLQFGSNQVIARVLTFGFAICVCVPIVYIPVRYLPPLFHHPVWYEGEYAEWKVHSWDPIDSDKYVSFEDVMGAVSGRLRPFAEKLFSEQEYPNRVFAEEMMDPTGIHVGPWYFAFDDPETQTYSSYLGRAATWYYYLFNGKLLGHSNLEGHHTGIGVSYNWHAQNAFLQIWYYYGIPAGILFLVVVYGTLLISVKRAWIDNDKLNEQAVFVMVFLALFILFGLFEAVWYPGQMILTLAVFSPKLMIDEENATE